MFLCVTADFYFFIFYFLFFHVHKFLLFWCPWEDLVLKDWIPMCFVWFDPHILHAKGHDLIGFNFVTAKQSKETQLCNLLPKLHHSTGEVFGICDAVVGVAAVCVPGIATSLPWQLLKI